MPPKNSESNVVQEGEPRGERQSNRRTFLRGVAAAAGVAGIMGTRSTGASASSDRNRGRANGDDEITGQRRPTLGANLNGRPRRLDENVDLVEKSNTTWVRAFIDVRKKLAEGTAPTEDPDVLALRRVAREQGCRLVVSLKWGFKVNWGWDEKESMRVPPAGSRHETELLRCATDYLAAIEEPVDVVVLGNEPMWETMTADFVRENPPIVRFTRAVKRHLVRHGDHGDPSYLLGSFNQLDNHHLMEYPFSAFSREMFKMAREDDDIDGIDLHVHYDDLAGARKMVETARKLLPDGVIAVTEFSPMRRFEKHVRTPIGGWESGQAFAEAYDYSPELSVVEYLEQAKADPRPRAEIGDFYAAMPWYDVNELRRIHDVFDEFDVSLATLGFMQDPGMRDADWNRHDWSPFHLNLLYQQALMEGDGAHPHYFEDYRKLAV